jgi:hypothetical protein
MCRVFRPLILAAACLLFAAPAQVEARQPFRPFYAPRSAYTPIQPMYRGVYVYPQVVTTPYYGFTYYPSWYGSYIYNPGSYRYAYTPWGSSYYYTNPSFYNWYWIR